MKKTSTFISSFVFLVLFLFNVWGVFASSCSNYGGSTTYCDDGTNYSNYGGSTTYGSDGSSYSNYGGSTTYGSDGSTQSNYGGSTTYDSDGKNYSNYGGSTTYGSDGSSYSNYGGSTTYGSGSGKMIDISGSDDSDQDNYSGSTTYGSDGGKIIDTGDNCPLNSSYNSSTQECECSLGYKSNGSSCVHQGADYSSDQQNDMPKENIRTPIIDNEQTDSSDSIHSLDDNSNNDQINQDTSVTNLKTQNKAKKFVWWNPLTWRGYFYNK